MLTHSHVSHEGEGTISQARACGEIRLLNCFSGMVLGPCRVLIVTFGLNFGVNTEEGQGEAFWAHATEFPLGRKQLHSLPAFMNFKLLWVWTILVVSRKFKQCFASALKNKNSTSDCFSGRFRPSSTGLSMAMALQLVNPPAGFLLHGDVWEVPGCFGLTNQS